MTHLESGIPELIDEGLRTGMNYYTFEYLILMSLTKRLRIESVYINSDFCNAVKTFRNSLGELETRVVSRMMVNDSIRLNFNLDFHYEFNRCVLKEAFIQGCDAETMARRLISNISDEFIRTFLARESRNG